MNLCRQSFFYRITLCDRSSQGRGKTNHGKANQGKVIQSKSGKARYFKEIQGMRVQVRVRQGNIWQVRVNKKRTR